MQFIGLVWQYGINILCHLRHWSSDLSRYDKLHWLYVMPAKWFSFSADYWLGTIFFTRIRYLIVAVLWRNYCIYNGCKRAGRLQTHVSLNLLTTPTYCILLSLKTWIRFGARFNLHYTTYNWLVSSKFSHPQNPDITNKYCEYIFRKLKY